MHVFVTGATGLIGSAVTAELLMHGHTVIGLARSEASASALQVAGARAVPGDLSDLQVLRAGAAEADGVIHLAFDHNFNASAAILSAVDQEAAALAAIGDELVGSGRPFVVCSGTPRTPGRPSTEADLVAVDGPVGGRGRSVQRVLGLASHGVRSAAVRLPRTVHNQGTGGFAGMLSEIARRTAVAGYPGDGTQRWPAVHALDAAALFRIVLESAPAGSEWHAVDDEGDSVRDIAEVIGRRLGLPVEAVSQETFGPLGVIFAADQPASSAHTRQQLNWTPTHPHLLEDLENLQP